MVGGGEHESLVAVLRRNPAFGSRIRVVQPGHALHKFRIDVVEHEAHTVGCTLLDARVQALELGTADVEILFEHAARAVPSARAIAHREFRILRQQLRRRGGGGALRSFQAGERVRGGGGQVVLAAIARSHRAEQLPRNPVELGEIDGQTDRVVADIVDFQHQVGSDALLNAQVPSHRIGAPHIGIDERDGLSGEGQQPERIAAGRQEAVGEGIGQRAGRQRRLVVVAGGGQRSGLAEAFLVGERVSRVLAVHAHRSDGHGRHEDAGAGPNGGLAVQRIGRPGQAHARAGYVRMILINGRLVRSGEGQPAEHAESAG